MTMGYRLVALACQPQHHLHLTDPARLILIQMARMARDKDDPPIYYGGWPFLALILGYPTYNEAAKTAVARAVRELTRKKLIEAANQPSPGRTVDYQVRLGL